MELYIHIPFCARKCAYCDFLSFADRMNLRDAYGEALLRDLSAYAAGCDGKPHVETVFIGGGTPSLMQEGFYTKLFAAIRRDYDLAENAEITIECNPGTVTPEKLSEYRAAGINRISFGAQSADDKELALLGRIHVWSEVEASVRMAREAGFDNVSIDLMMNLPGQTCDGFARTLERAIALAPEHISAYSLIVEPGTAFYERYAEHPELLPSDEEASRTYETAVKLLAKAGYEQYEISNFAKEGFACRHNIGYWRRAEYLGVGIGAASLIGDRRFSVSRDITAYLEKLTYVDEEVLSKADQRNETVMLGLRMNEGIDLVGFREKYGDEAAEELLSKAQKYVSAGLANVSGDRLALTVRGMLVSNAILADLIE
ncbi:MAG: radical SAM family heme chaperone HemW [Lachnospiraceae bacterium]|nr:radical SAM family heme chaperone HemW [Lachnospiraceae bacterium]